MRSAGYRPDIDGLRAVAVTSILLFHFDVPGFKGGFVGVDVFFVISGFLITRLIVEEYQRSGHFDFGQFYVRRVRRLMPALAVTLAATLVAGWLWLTPELFRQAAWSVFAASLSVSNFYFAEDAGNYFSTAALLKPALHTWSLSVEEQFYLLWPVALVFLLQRKNPRVLFGALAGCALASLVFAQFWWDRPTAFFLMPFRVFEFALGAAIVWVPSLRLRAAMQEMSLLAGLALIGVAVLTFDKYVRFPGLAALVPCAGAALAIVSGEARLIGLALRNPVCVGLGLISYSLYLVHWPLVVFLRLSVVEPGAAQPLPLLLFLSLACALIIYVAVERPVRSGQYTGWILGRIALGGLVLVTAPAAAIAISGGVEARFPPDVASALSPSIVKESEALTWARLRTLSRDFADNGKTKVLIIGDSQAGDFLNILAESRIWDQVDIASLPSSSHCQSLFAKPIRDDFVDYCERITQRIKTEPRVKTADVIVLAFAWRLDGVEPLLDNVERLRSLGTDRVIVIGPKAQGMSGPEMLARLRTFNGIERYAAAHPNVDARNANDALKRLAGPFDFIDVMAAICPSPDMCHVVDEQKNPIFFDTQHISKSAIAHASRLIVGDGSGLGLIDR